MAVELSALSPSKCVVIDSTVEMQTTVSPMMVHDPGYSRLLATRTRVVVIGTECGYVPV